MNERAQAWWRRHAALLAAALLHAGLLWLILPYMIGGPPPPSDPVDVAMVPPAPLPKPVRPKPVPKPADRPAEPNATAGRLSLRPAPRLARVTQPPIDLKLPPPLLPKPPMSLPAASAPAPAGPPTGGAPGNGSGGGNGNGTGNGTQEGNDYLIRLKTYIDAHKGGDRHLEPHDADLVLTLDPDGRLTDIHVVSSSGDPAVDDEIVTQLKQMSPFPKPPAILFNATRPLLAVADKWIFARP
jgi:TonB family protein